MSVIYSEYYLLFLLCQYNCYKIVTIRFTIYPKYCIILVYKAFFIFNPALHRNVRGFTSGKSVVWGRMFSYSSACIVPPPPFILPPLFPPLSSPHLFLLLPLFHLLLFFVPLFLFPSTRSERRMWTRNRIVLV